MYTGCCSLPIHEPRHMLRNDQDTRRGRDLGYSGLDPGPGEHHLSQAGCPQHTNVVETACASSDIRVLTCQVLAVTKAILFLQFPDVGKLHRHAVTDVSTTPSRAFWSGRIHGSQCFDGEVRAWVSLSVWPLIISPLVRESFLDFLGQGPTRHVLVVSSSWHDDCRRIPTTTLRAGQRQSPGPGTGRHEGGPSRPFILHLDLLLSYPN